VLRWPKIFVSVLIAFAALGGRVFYWWNQVRDQVPAGIAWSNGRIEADEIDIDRNLPGELRNCASMKATLRVPAKSSPSWM